MSELSLSILTPARKILEREHVLEIFAPGFKGQLNILPNHANLVTQLETGVLRWRSNAGWRSASISTGLLEIFNGHVSVMADVSELSEEIDVSRAKAAGEKARKQLEEGGLDDENFRKYQLKLKRSVSRISATTEA